jgi:hypothetical protein
MPLNWNFPANFGPENREQVTGAASGEVTVTITNLDDVEDLSGRLDSAVWKDG